MGVAASDMYRLRILCRENVKNCNYAHILSQKLQLRAYFVAKMKTITITRFGGQVQFTKYDGGQVRGFKDRVFGSPF